MLREFMNVSQRAKGYRRLFTDEKFQLYVWYDKKGGEANGFQLVYGIRNAEKALTWTVEEGFIHTGIDEGDTRGFNRSPILVQDGTFPYDALYASVLEAFRELEPEVRNFVLGKLAEYSFRVSGN